MTDWAMAEAPSGSGSSGGQATVIDGPGMGTKILEAIFGDADLEAGS